MRRWIVPFTASAALTMLAAACATSPTGRSQLKLVSDAQMDQMGVTAFQQMKQKTPPTKDAKASAYVNCVANAITREVGGGRNWEVQVFEDKQVNAFALPGGYIYIHSGLLAYLNSEAELAAVLDAALQDPERRPALLSGVIAPLAAAQAAQAEATARKAAATRVQFFTMASMR